MKKSDTSRSLGKFSKLRDRLVLILIMLVMLAWALMSKSFRIVGDWLKGDAPFSSGTVSGLMHFIIFGLILYLAYRWRKLKSKASRFEELRDDLSTSEEQLISSMNRMTAGVAHEINNPLAGIKNCMMLLRDAVPEDHKYYPYAGMIDKEVERISEITTKMLQLYQPRENSTPVVISLQQIILETGQLLEPYLGEKELRLNVDVPSNFPDVEVQRTDFLDILRNLMINAAQASPVRGEIEVTCRHDDSVFTVAVSDQGSGIAKEVLPHIFEPFFTTKDNEKQKGLGLGLSLSRSLAIFMGGRILVDTKEGAGTTFIVELPLYPSPKKAIQRKL